MIETVFVLALLTLACTSSLALTKTWRERTRTLGAARLVLSQVRVARALAVRDGAAVALVFRRDARGVFSFGLYRDGNADGVRHADIDRGIDSPIAADLRLADWFPGTALQVPFSLPPIDDGSVVAAGSTPIRLGGGGTVLSCAPAGTTTSGTLYLTGPDNRVFAIRLLGTTGRVRLFEYLPDSSAWREAA